MVSELEGKVRQLDDKEKTIAENARAIAVQLNAKEGTVRQILQAKRKGHDSLTHYRYHVYQKKHGTSLGNWRSEALRKKFGSTSLGVEYYTNNRGFFSEHEYKTHLARERYGFDSVCRLYAFIQGLPLPKVIPKPVVKYWPNEKLDKLPFERTDYDERVRYTQTLAYVAEAFNRLTERQKSILEKRFVEGKTQNTTRRELAQLEGRNVPYTPQNISLIEKKALERMRNYLKAHTEE